MPEDASIWVLYHGCYIPRIQAKSGYTMSCTLHIQLDTLGHYTVYALEGRGGEVRWHLTPKDFHFNPAFNPVRMLAPIIIQ